MGLLLDLLRSEGEVRLGAAAGVRRQLEVTLHVLVTRRLEDRLLLLLFFERGQGFCSLLRRLWWVSYASCVCDIDSNTRVQLLWRGALLLCISSGFFRFATAHRLQLGELPCSLQSASFFSYLTGSFRTFLLAGRLLGVLRRNRLEARRVALFVVRVFQVDDLA